MKLLKKQVEKICDNYSLGKLESIKEMKGGLISYNFYLKTNKGDFVIKAIGKKLNSDKRRELNLGFKALNYLKKKKFPYEITIPLKNKKRQFFIRIDNKDLWVYKMMKGKSTWYINNIQFKELSKVQAIYHNYIKDIKVKKQNRFFKLSWLLKEYSKLKNIKVKNKTDKLVSDNLEYFENLLKKLNKIQFDEKIILIHHDFDPSNVLFQGNKITAIIDFDNIKAAPRIVDIANTMRDTCFHRDKLDNKKFNLYLKEYEKIAKLSKKEKEIIISCMLVDSCIVFWWFYARMKKDLHNKYKFIKSNIQRTKDLMKGWEVEG